MKLKKIKIDDANVVIFHEAFVVYFKVRYSPGESMEAPHSGLPVIRV
jgi:hypothetical protein